MHTAGFSVLGTLHALGSHCVRLGGWARLLTLQPAALTPPPTPHPTLSFFPTCGRQREQHGAPAGPAQRRQPGLRGRRPTVQRQPLPVRQRSLGSSSSVMLRCAALHQLLRTERCKAMRGMARNAVLLGCRPAVLPRLQCCRPRAEPALPTVLVCHVHPGPACAALATRTAPEATLCCSIRWPCCLRLTARVGDVNPVSSPPTAATN